MAQNNNKNLYVYIAAGVISVIAITVGALVNCISALLSTVFIGIGCSGVSAALVAGIIEWRDSKSAELRKARMEESYLRPFYQSLIEALQRILWFEDRLVEKDFNWSLNPEQYSLAGYMLDASMKYPPETIDIVEARKHLRNLAEKYALHNLKSLNTEQKQRVVCMFQIVTVCSTDLLRSKARLVEKEIELDLAGVGSLDELQELSYKVSLAFVVFASPEKNIGLGINCLVDLEEQLHERFDFNTNFKVALQGSYKEFPDGISPFLQYAALVTESKTDYSENNS